MRSVFKFSVPTHFIIWILLALYPLVGMGVDLIAPSLPAMSQHLHVSSAWTKNLVSIYLLGYALGNFSVGFLSDALGRRKLILAGFIVFTVASVLPIIFPSIFVLLLARFLQGLGIAAFAVLVRAVFSDLLSKEKLMQTMVMLATMWAIGPIIGPLIGGYLQFYFNWQACFIFFSILGLIGFLVMLFTLPETHEKRQALNFVKIRADFAMIITHRTFLGIIILMGLMYSQLIIFNTLGPFLVQTIFGYSPIVFGHIALCLGAIFLIGTIICRRLIQHFLPAHIFKIAIPSCFLLALIGCCISFFIPKNLTWMMLLSGAMFLGCGIIYPTGMSASAAIFRHLAGSAAAVMNLINVLLTTSMAVLMGFIPATALLWVYLALLLGASFCYYFLIQEKTPSIAPTI